MVQLQDSPLALIPPSAVGRLLDFLVAVFSCASRVESVVLLGEDDVGFDRVIVGLLAGAHVLHRRLLEAFPIGAHARRPRPARGERGEVLALRADLVPPTPGMGEGRRWIQDLKEEAGMEENRGRKRGRGKEERNG